jgi:hypothetical protein
VRSVAIPEEVERQLAGHLTRDDLQEDLCFALWRPSTGKSRLTALVHEVVQPELDDRNVHGNVSFEPQYFERALGRALAAGSGLALLHSHPGGRGWQGMSSDDVAAERGHAAQALAATGLPLVGLTLATHDGRWSARTWEKTAPRNFERRECSTVRSVGSRLSVSFNPELVPPPPQLEEQLRTRSAWGDAAQGDIARLRVGIVGLGSVGALVAETLARTGVRQIRLIDFDVVERHNLDRLVHATHGDLGRAKVDVSADRLKLHATASDPDIKPLDLSIVEPEGFLEALDCDLLFSCVDRPWPRHVLNFIAYTHLIPVVDGGVLVEVTSRNLMRAANWKAHIAAPGRRCLECLGQYDSGLVDAERHGYFDDPSYIERLPDDHPIKRSENVFAFSMGCAALEVGQMLSMVVAPSGVSDYGAQNYHLVSGTIDLDTRGCNANCPFTNQLLAQGNRSGFVVTGRHEAAETAREARRENLSSQPTGRLGRWLDRLRSRRLAAN